jgi:hypothetical protein
MHMFRKYVNRTSTVIMLAVIGLSSQTSHAEQANKQGFDLAAYDSVLKTFVNEKAMVNYRKLKAQRQQLDAFAVALGKLPRETYEKWSDQDKIAFWLNAYNGLTLKAIVDNYPIKSSFLKSRIWPKNSIRQISGVWKKLKFPVMGRRVTLWNIEHEILRKKFNEPRIHMAMVCAAMGCPPLRGEPYEGDRLDEQLDDQTRRFLGDSAKFKIDSRKGTVYLSEILKWFADDFVRKHSPKRNIGRHDKKMSAVLNFVAPYLSDSQKKYVLAGKFKIKYVDYDWSLNEQRTGK